MDWDAYTGGGTAVLAVVTVWLAWSTRAMARAALADQSSQWRPVLIVGPTNEAHIGPNDDGRDVLTVSVRNVGRGPALGVQAQLRCGVKPLGATPPKSMLALAPGESMELPVTVPDDRVPSALKMTVSYHDIAERWHETIISVVPEEYPTRWRTASVFVVETERHLGLVHDAPRAKAAEARRQRRIWNRAARSGRRASALVRRPKP